MKSKRMVVITYGYPCSASPNEFVFLKKLMCDIANTGMRVTVIHPIASSGRGNVCKNTEESLPGLDVYEIEYPFYKLLFPLRPLHIKIIDNEFYQAAYRAIKELGLDTDDTVLYSHFLNAGLCVSRLSEELGLKAYCAVGESTFWSVKYRRNSDVVKRLSHISRFISVSTENKDMLLKAGYCTEDKITVLPNGVDTKRFNKKDKSECRKKIGYSSDDALGIFVGAFIDRKGPRRVEKAVQSVSNLQMIYIGKGADAPDGEKAFFVGEVKHDDIPTYLSAADFFVLPTLNEGCCNAILEAMACGLPVISSAGRFNDDILDDTYSIRVNPQNIEEINSAVIDLSADRQKRDEMSAAAVKASEKFSLEERAKKIRRLVENAD